MLNDLPEHRVGRNVYRTGIGVQGDAVAIADAPHSKVFDGFDQLFYGPVTTKLCVLATSAEIRLSASYAARSSMAGTGAVPLFTFRRPATFSRGLEKAGFAGLPTQTLDETCML